MNILLFGPAGSGKGTQAELLAKQFGMTHFSMGEALRSEAAKNTALGKKIKAIINKGILVSDDISEKILLSALGSQKMVASEKNKGAPKKGSKSSSNKSSNTKGIIFDGFPRNVLQAERIKKYFRIDAAIEINVPDSEVIKRISARRVCTKCGANYNIMWLKPKKEGICDKCNSELKMRDDDKPEEIKKRLSIYKEQTFPVKKFFEQEGAAYTVDGTKSIKEVNDSIIKILAAIER